MVWRYEKLGTAQAQSRGLEIVVWEWEKQGGGEVELNKEYIMVMLTTQFIALIWPGNM